MKPFHVFCSFTVFLFCMSFIGPVGNGYDSCFPEYFFTDTRRFMADMMWLKTDQYHHTEHASPDEEIALCRLVIRLNPSHTDAYTVASHLLSSRMGKPEEALELIRSGIRACSNRQGIDILHAELGFLLLFHGGSLADARESLVNAVNTWPGRNDDGSFFTISNYYRLLYFTACLMDNNGEIRFFSKKLSEYGLDVPGKETVRQGFSQHMDQLRKSLKGGVEVCPVCGHIHGHDQHGEHSDHELHSSKSSETGHRHVHQHGLNTANYPLHMMRKMPFEKPGYAEEMITASLTLCVLLAVMIAISLSAERSVQKR